MTARRSAPWYAVIEAACREIATGLTVAAFCLCPVWPIDLLPTARRRYPPATTALPPPHDADNPSDVYSRGARRSGAPDNEADDGAAVDGRPVEGETVEGRPIDGGTVGGRARRLSDPPHGHPETVSGTPPTAVERRLWTDLGLGGSPPTITR